MSGPTGRVATTEVFGEQLLRTTALGKSFDPTVAAPD